MVEPGSQFRLSPDVARQSLGPGQDTVLLSLTTGCLFRCNETAARFVELLDGRRTVEQAVAQMVEEYDAPAETLRADMLALAEKLAGLKLIV
jgi:hypothetical protein